MEAASLTFDIPLNERPLSSDQTLVYYDGPQLFWMTLGGQDFLFLAVPADDEQSWPCLATPLDAEQRRRLEQGEVTLLRAIVEGAAHYHVADLYAEVLVLCPLEQLPEDWLPGDVTLPLPSSEYADTKLLDNVASHR